MKVGLVTIAYKEERFIEPFIKHIPDWVDEILVLNSSEPWIGEANELDETAKLAKLAGARVVRNHWLTEADQRNTGQDLMEEMDWIINLDPDEFLDEEGWENLKALLTYPMQDAYICQHQRVFYKTQEVSPHTDYQQIILTRPWVKFVDKRVVATNYGIAPVELYHFSWARTDEEVLRKITHYSHANEFDGQEWFKKVWKTDQKRDLHPLTPETLKRLIPAVLPSELAELNLWPPKS